MTGKKKFDHDRIRGLIALILSESFDESLKIKAIRGFFDSSEWKEIHKNHPEIDRQVFLSADDNRLISSILQSAIDMESTRLDFFNEQLTKKRSIKKNFTKILLKAQEYLKNFQNLSEDS